MLNTLILSLDYYLKACRNNSNMLMQKAFFNQAFGACQYHIMMFPNDQMQVEALWTPYKEQFEEIIYGA